MMKKYIILFVTLFCLLMSSPGHTFDLLEEFHISGFYIPTGIGAGVSNDLFDVEVLKSRSKTLFYNSYKITVHPYRGLYFTGYDYKSKEKMNNNNDYLPYYRCKDLDKYDTIEPMWKIYRYLNYQRYEYRSGDIIYISPTIQTIKCKNPKLLLGFGLNTRPIKLGFYSNMRGKYFSTFDINIILFDYSEVLIEIELSEENMNGNSARTLKLNLKKFK